MNYNKKLTPYEYFLQLQVEYMSIAIRSKIFTSPKSKQYWEDIREKKRIYIEIFAQNNNHLKTIFSDPELLEKVESIFFLNGIPNFTYRSVDNEAKQKPYDLRAYYEPNKDIIYLSSGGGQEIGVIKRYYLPSNQVDVITTDNQIERIDIKGVRRILNIFY